jgi:hypothetical protein
MADTQTSLVECRDWRRSHPDNAYWRAYYAAFEIKHGRPSTDHEFDPDLSRLVQVVVTVFRASIQDMMQ